MFGDDNNQDQNNAGNQNGVPAPTSVPAPTNAPSGDNSSSFNSPSMPSYNNFQPPVSTPDDTQPAAPASTPAGNDLLNIKQDALQQLKPLVSHLDQTPEEKFRTTMMMIQAADDQNLITGAYEAAKQITDEKARAQALLDVVNEINYFTQQNNNEQS